MLSHEQVSLLTRTPGARQAVVESDQRQWPATVTSIGSLADASTGLLPVLLEVQNSDESLRCGIRVSVRFVDMP
jgi:multidrug efflux pump subunit AcrA (membrane-fusion protein)